VPGEMRGIKLCQRFFTYMRGALILAREYRPLRAGLPGNDDAGTMSSWYVWNAVGLYPNSGQPYYYIGSPLFHRA
ncbi:MAG TPA: hypothetical protein DCK99_20220, partial [Blastocatellia bacterium]|nr:hypothetical protein [Blastocatellia bacterium]